MRAKTEKKAYFNCDIWMGGIVTLCVLIIIIVSLGIQNYKPFDTQNDNSFEQGWTTSGMKVDSLKNLEKLPKASDGGLILKNTLPQHLDGDICLNFRSKNINFTLSVDGKTIYTFYPEVGKVAGKTYGSCFHSIPVSQWAGKTIVLTAYPVYHDNSCFFNMMTLETQGVYYQQFLETHLASFLICLVTSIFGLFLLIFSFLFRKDFNDSQALGYLGLFVICMSLWSGMETMVPQMLFGDLTFLHGFNYLLLMIMPYPGIQFTNALMTKPDHHYTRVVFGVVMSVLAISITLNWTGIKDFHEMLWLTHLALAGTAVMIVYMCVQEIRLGKTRGVRSDHWIFISALVLFLIFAVGDLIYYRLTGQGSSDAGFFMRIGFLLFTVIVSTDAFLRLLRKTRLAEQTEAIRILAFTDTLTGVESRAAFTKREQELTEGVKMGTIAEVTVLQFDINELKQVNDQFGHAAGDKHICAAATVITDAFHDLGSCYRIGGDEFAVFIVKEHLEDQLLAQALEAMGTGAQTYNRESGAMFPLEIACGKAVYNQTKGSIEEVENEADRDMYLHKHMMKAKKFGQKRKRNS